MVYRILPTILLLALTGSVCNAQQGTFPELKAQNLEKKILSLPSDFSGEVNLVFIAFEQDQQREVDSWLDAAPYIFKGNPAIPVYEVAAIGKEYKLAKYFIDRGMRIKHLERGTARPIRSRCLSRRSHSNRRFRLRTRIGPPCCSWIVKGKVLWRGLRPILRHEGQLAPICPGRVACGVALNKNHLFLLSRPSG